MKNLRGGLSKRADRFFEILKTADLEIYRSVKKFETIEQLEKSIKNTTLDTKAQKELIQRISQLNDYQDKLNKKAAPIIKNVQQICNMMMKDPRLKQNTPLKRQLSDGLRWSSDYTKRIAEIKSKKFQKYEELSKIQEENKSKLDHLNKEEKKIRRLMKEIAKPKKIIKLIKEKR